MLDSLAYAYTYTLFCSHRAVRVRRRKRYPENRRRVKGLPEPEWRELYEGIIGETSALAYFSLYNLGHAERQAGRYPEAVAFLEQAVRVMPDRAGGWLELGRACEDMGQGERAAEAFRRAAELKR